MTVISYEPVRVCPACRGTGAQGLGLSGPLRCELSRDHITAPSGVELVPAALSYDWWADRLDHVADANLEDGGWLA